MRKNSDAGERGGGNRGVRALIFFAIVWSIAGAFLALHIGMPALFDQAVKAGWIPDSLAIPDASKLSAGCTMEEQSRIELSDEARRAIRHAAWRMGFELGSVAGLASMGRLDTDRRSQSIEWLTNIARDLNVPAPLLPEIGQSANALHEFEVYVERDAQCIAALLSTMYAENAGSVYKLSAYIGHAASWRIASPDIGALFVPNIRHHAKSAEIPSELLQPLLAVEGEPEREKLAHDINRLDEYFKTAK
jgi:hypothetical protein